MLGSAVIAAKLGRHPIVIALESICHIVAA
jgi:hypothetical protein